MCILGVHENKFLSNAIYMKRDYIKANQAPCETLSFTCPVCRFLINVKERPGQIMFFTSMEEKKIFDFIRECVRKEFQNKNYIY